MAVVIDHPRFKRPEVVPEPPEPDQAALVWQARAQVEIATLIERYLSEHPSPPTASHPAAYRRWASGLRAAGDAALARLGERRLR